MHERNRENMRQVVVRFAPSPTGYLHIGGARTAIFNWLYARKHMGRFILRIEDTDAERSTVDAIEGILDGLKWLGLDWDAGPYFQSAFIGDHQSAAEQLLTSGNAYKCFCSKEALDEKRDQAHRHKTTYQYDGTCRNLSRAQLAKNEAAGLPYTVRFKVPRRPGAVVFNDAVYGCIEKQYQDIEDFIVLRTNKSPLYVLSNAVDDIRDRVTHVIRGQDGLANTPKQVLIYQGLGAALPQFAHMSLTLDPQKAKISKRKHGEQVAIHYYRKMGFLPWAMVNFLVLLGWSPGDDREFFSLEALIKAFDLGGIGRTNSVFNVNAGEGKFFTDPKLLNTNAHYLRTMDMASLVPLIKTQLQQADLWHADYDHHKRAWLEETITLIRDRYQTLLDFTTHGRCFFSDTFPMDPDAYEQHVGKDPAVMQWLLELLGALEEVPVFEAKSIEDVLRSFLATHQLKPGVLINAVRTAISGTSVGPDFMRMLVCLGQRRVVARLQAFVTHDG